MWLYVVQVPSIFLKSSSCRNRAGNCCVVENTTSTFHFQDKLLSLKSCYLWLTDLRTFYYCYFPTTSPTPEDWSSCHCFYCFSPNVQPELESVIFAAFQPYVPPGSVVARRSRNNVWQALRYSRAEVMLNVMSFEAPPSITLAPGDGRLVGITVRIPFTDSGAAGSRQRELDLRGRRDEERGSRVSPCPTLQHHS